jgi:hypothetical protein
MKIQIQFNQVVRFLKKEIKFCQAAFVLICCVSLCSCEPKQPDEGGLIFNILVLNEGVWNMNNGSITAYNTSTNEQINDIFSHVNKQQLGDVANDILLYGSKVYVAVSISSQICVMDLKSGVLIKQIPITTSGVGNQPRQIASHNGKIYVCCFDGSVLKIDTTSLLIEATEKASRNPDGICVANNKLYVSNSGGLDYPNYDSTVSVFDLSTFTKINRIEVRVNPTLMKTDKKGNVYVVSNGNYDDVSPCLQRINTITDKVEKVFDIGISIFDIYNDYLYFYTYDYVSGSTSYQVLDLLQDSIINKNFISNDDLPKTPNGINVNPRTGDIYIFDALDYTSMGDVYCFDNNGKKKFKFEAGIIPKKAVFK